MRILLFLEKSLLPFCALAGCLCLGVQSLSGQPATLQQRITSAGGRVEDIEQRTGPFAIAGQNYTVVLHGKRLVNVSDPTLVQTVAGVEISDAAGNVSYRKIFPYAIEQDRFQRNLSAFCAASFWKNRRGPCDPLPRANGSVPDERAPNERVLATVWLGERQARTSRQARAHR